MAMTSILVTLARMASVRMVGMDSGMHFTGCPVPLITETCLKKTVQHYGLDTPGSPLFACRLRLSVTIIVTLVGWGGVGSMVSGRLNRKLQLSAAYFASSYFFAPCDLRANS